MAAPVSTPSVDVCGEICTYLSREHQNLFCVGHADADIDCTGSTVCANSGVLPPTTDDCQKIVDAFTILNGQIRECLLLSGLRPGTP